MKRIEKYHTPFKDDYNECKKKLDALQIQYNDEVGILNKEIEDKENSCQLALDKFLTYENNNGSITKETCQTYYPRDYDEISPKCNIEIKGSACDVENEFTCRKDLEEKGFDKIELTKNYYDGDTINFCEMIRDTGLSPKKLSLDDYKEMMSLMLVEKLTIEYKYPIITGDDNQHQDSLNDRKQKIKDADQDFFMKDSTRTIQEVNDDSLTFTEPHNYFAGDFLVIGEEEFVEIKEIKNNVTLSTTVSPEKNYKTARKIKPQLINKNLIDLRASHTQNFGELGFQKVLNLIDDIKKTYEIEKDILLYNLRNYPYKFEGNYELDDIINKWKIDMEKNNFDRKVAGLIYFKTVIPKYEKRGESGETWITSHGHDHGGYKDWGKSPKKFAEFATQSGERGSNLVDRPTQNRHPHRPKFYHWTLNLGTWGKSNRDEGIKCYGIRFNEKLGPEKLTLPGDGYSTLNKNCTFEKRRPFDEARTYIMNDGRKGDDTDNRFDKKDYSGHLKNRINSLEIAFWVFMGIFFIFTVIYFVVRYSKYNSGNLDLQGLFYTLLNLYRLDKPITADLSGKSFAPNSGTFNLICPWCWFVLGIGVCLPLGLEWSQAKHDYADRLAYYKKEQARIDALP
jgi:hypothetical protein